MDSSQMWQTRQACGINKDRRQTDWWTDKRTVEPSDSPTVRVLSSSFIFSHHKTLIIITWRTRFSLFWCCLLLLFRCLQVNGNHITSHCLGGMAWASCLSELLWGSHLIQARQSIRSTQSYINVILKTMYNVIKQKHRQSTDTPREICKPFPLSLPQPWRT